MKTRFFKKIFLIKSILLILLCTLLVSCLSIESDIALKDNGSGIITLTYHISDAFKAISAVGEEQKPLPLPIYKTDFELLAQLDKGLVLKSHTIKETDAGTVITAALSFADMKSLASVAGDDETSFSFSKEGSERVFILRLPFAGDAEYSEDSIEMIKTYCADDYFLYRITTPGPIRGLSQGEIKSDKKHAEYRIKIADLLLSKERITIEVRW